MTTKNTFKQEKASVLRKTQKKLIDEFILDTNKIEKIMAQYTAKMGIFHNYSLGNLVLAHYQLQMMGYKEGLELLAPYKRWNKINRNVRKGEKAVYILAPIFKEIKNEEGEVIDKKMWFKKVPVFDLQQTEGEPFEPNYVINPTQLSFKEISSRLNIPVYESEKMITRGYTNGREIWVSKHTSEGKQLCTLFHELAHYFLHFNKDRKELTSATKELEAEAISFMVASALGITNTESGAYITNWAGENSPELIEGKGEKLIRTASKIIDLLDLNGEVTNVASSKKEVIEVEA